MAAGSERLLGELVPDVDPEGNDSVTLEGGTGRRAFCSICHRFQSKLGEMVTETQRRHSHCSKLRSFCTSASHLLFIPTHGNTDKRHFSFHKHHLFCSSFTLTCRRLGLRRLGFAFACLDVLLPHGQRPRHLRTITRALSVAPTSPAALTC